MNDEVKQKLLLMVAIFATVFFLMPYIIPPPKENKVQNLGQEPAVQAAAAPASSDATINIDESAPDSDYRVSVRRGSDAPGGDGYEAVFSSIGAGMSDYSLLGFYRTPEKKGPGEEVLLLKQVANGVDTMSLEWTAGTTAASLSKRNFKLIAIPKGAKVEPAPGPDVEVTENRLTFQTTINGWAIIRSYEFFNADRPFTIASTIEWHNQTDQPRQLSYRVRGPTGMLPDDATSQFGPVNILTARQPDPNSSVVEVETEPVSSLVKMKDLTNFDNRANIAWVGAKNRFFAALMSTSKPAASNGVIRMALAVQPGFLPQSEEYKALFKAQPTVNLASGPAPVVECTSLGVLAGTVQPGSSYKMANVFYGGPASDELMLIANPLFSKVIYYTFSWFEFISRALVKLLNLLDRWLGNYGLAIIALTIIVRCVLHPLNRKSFVSMQRMQIVAPLVKEAQKKYAGDKVKSQQEVMRIYKENNVSMTGGCLPMFIQLPIFFALYGAFSQGFSIRHAVFIPGWINDLSRPDSVYNLGFNVPLLNSSHISLLPIIYLGLQILQMSMQPKPTDPQQAQQQRIMKIMPIMFVFIFYAMPAGLVLYFTVSALFGVVENWWMKNVLGKRLGLTPAPAGTGTTALSKAAAGVGTAPSSETDKSAKKKKKAR